MSWTGKSEGTALGYSIFVYSIKFFGLRFSYFILRFVSLYYYFFLPSKKEHLEYLYRERLGYSKRQSNRLISKNFNLVGQSIIDRVSFLVGRGKRITYEEKGEHFLRELAKSKKGAFLISAHLGNWNIAGNFLSDLGIKVNVLMYQNEKETIQKVLSSQGKEYLFEIIPIKEDMSHFISIYNAIKRGEFVCVHADRFSEGSSTFSLPFLGESAEFPAGVFQIIEKLKAPYSFVFMVKKTTFSYYFSATEPKSSEKTAKEIAIDFIQVLENYVKMFPEQWFNYYRFFSTRR